MAQLMPLLLTVSCFSKIQIDFTFLVPAHLGSPGKKGHWMGVCVYDTRIVGSRIWDQGLSVEFGMEILQLGLMPKAR